jgi:DNA glycosylase AlkZ-like
LSEPVLSARALNRALLARQLLLERAALPLPDGLERVAGLQTQYAPSGYVGLWSRVRDFRREALTEALATRAVVQGTLMRATIHLVSAADYRLLAAGTGPARRAWLLRVQRQALEGIDMEVVADRVRALLAHGPRRQVDLQAALAAEGYPRVAWGSAGQWVDLVRVPPSGTWERRRADLYGLADDWLREAPASEADGLARLVTAYLGGFGPAPLGDIASWAGLPTTTLQPIAAGLELRRFRDDSGRELLDLPEAPLPDPDTPAPIRFLPTWDATLLAHARRTQILPERYRPRVFTTRTPHSVGTFLVDGAVAGTWRPERDRIVTAPFEALPPAVQRDLDDEAERLAAFHAG